MKTRIFCIILALALMIPVMTVSFANEAEESQVIVEETVAEETAVFYLDGEPLYDVVAQCIGGTYYVTLASMMPLLDATAVVEENSGAATVTAEAVEVTEVASEEEPLENTVPEGMYTTTVVTTTLEADPVTGALIPVTKTTVMVVDPFTGLLTPLKVEDDEEEQTEAVVEVLDTLTLTAQVGDEYLVANGRYLYAAEGVIALEGNVAVPIRVLAKALNMSVGFDKDTGSVTLNRSEEIGYLEDGDVFYEEESVYWLSRIIYSESGNQPLAGKIAVGNVVLNRVYNPNFPDTIYDVIFQKNQFSPASSGSIHRDPNASSVIAAKLVLDGAEVLDDVLFFNQVGLKCYASKNRTFVATIGGHSFYA